MGYWKQGIQTRKTTLSCHEIFLFPLLLLSLIKQFFGFFFKHGFIHANSSFPVPSCSMADCVKGIDINLSIQTKWLKYQFCLYSFTQVLILSQNLLNKFQFFPWTQLLSKLLTVNVDVTTFITHVNTNLSS